MGIRIQLFTLCNADRDLDPDPAFKNNVNACLSGSANLETPNFALFFIEVVNYSIRYKVFDGTDPEP
jgi:hypothetical protein